MMVEDRTFADVEEEVEDDEEEEEEEVEEDNIDNDNCTKTVLSRIEIGTGDVEEEEPSVGRLLTGTSVNEAAAVLLGNPRVPDGLRMRAMYPYRLSAVFPQVSLGNPGHGSLHELVEVVSPGA